MYLSKKSNQLIQGSACRRARLFCWFLAFALLTTLAAGAIASKAYAIDPASGEIVDNGTTVKWVLDSDGTLTFSGDGTLGGSNAVRDSLQNASVDISQVKKVVIQQGVTGPRTGSSQFGASKGFTGLESVVIESSPFEMKMTMFSDCTSLKSVVFSDGCELKIGARAFNGCAGLVGTFDLSNTKLTSIPSTVFRGTNVTEVLLPDTLETISGGAFTEPSTLERVVIPSSVKQIGDGDGFSVFTKIPEIVFPIDFNGTIPTVNSYTDLFNMPPNNEVSFIVHGRTYDDQVNTVLETALLDENGDPREAYSFTYEPHAASVEAFTVAPDTTSIEYVCSECGDTIHYDVAWAAPEQQGEEGSLSIKVPTISVTDSDGTKHEVTDLGKPINLTLPVTGVEDGKSVNISTLDENGAWTVLAKNVTVENGAVSLPQPVEALGSYSVTAVEEPTDPSDPGTDDPTQGEDKPTDPDAGDPTQGGDNPTDPATNPDNHNGSGGQDAANGNGGNTLKGLAQTGDSTAAAATALALCATASVVVAGAALRKRCKASSSR